MAAALHRVTEIEDKELPAERKKERGRKNTCQGK